MDLDKPFKQSPRWRRWNRMWCPFVFFTKVWCEWRWQSVLVPLKNLTQLTAGLGPTPCFCLTLEADGHPWNKWQGFNWRMGIPKSFANGKVVGNHHLDHHFGVPGRFVFDHHFRSHHGMFTSPTFHHRFGGRCFVGEDFRMDFHKTKKICKDVAAEALGWDSLLKQLQ